LLPQKFLLSLLKQTKMLLESVLAKASQHIWTSWLKKPEIEFSVCDEKNSREEILRDPHELFRKQTAGEGELCGFCRECLDIYYQEPEESTTED